MRPRLLRGRRQDCSASQCGCCVGVDLCRAVCSAAGFQHRQRGAAFNAAGSGARGFAAAAGCHWLRVDVWLAVACGWSRGRSARSSAAADVRPCVVRVRLARSGAGSVFNLFDCRPADRCSDRPGSARDNRGNTDGPRAGIARRRLQPIFPRRGRHRARLRWGSWRGSSTLTLVKRNSDASAKSPARQIRTPRPRLRYAKC